MTYGFRAFKIFLLKYNRQKLPGVASNWDQTQIINLQNSILKTNIIIDEGGSHSFENLELKIPEILLHFS